MSKKFYAYQGSQKERALSTIVAIGASPGGLEAAVVLFSHLPADTGMCFIYVEHLDHTRKNDPVTSIQQVTEMPVTLVLEAMPLQPNYVYIIPPNREIQISQNRFSVHALPEKPTHRLPADRLFTTLAAVYAEQVIGIVLSGVTRDGTIGLQAIRAAGGFNFVQDDTALFKNMPRSAIAAGVADKVLAPQAMATELQWLGRQLAAFEELSGDNSDIHAILQLLQTAASIDFSEYKPGGINRRVVRRMLLLRLNTLKEYIAYLQQHKEEAELLCQDLLIQVTGFFRDAEIMQYLGQQLLPRLFQDRPHNEPLRIWVPACSTGEEAWSIAILLQECMEAIDIRAPVKIFATDASKAAIAKARKGIYSKSEVAGISAERLQRFFVQVNDQYKVNDGLRDCCIFSVHNVLKDPPFSRIRLISCCNLFIYLKKTAQEKLLSTFHFALMPGGYLVMGRSETVGASTPLFTPVDEHLKIFAREAADNTIDWSKEADDIIAARYLPAAVIVNQRLDILQFRGSTGKFLEHLPGKASLNLVNMASPQLVMTIKNALQKVMATNQPVTGVQQRITIETIPLSVTNLFLIVFSEQPQFAVKEAAAAIHMLQDVSEALDSKTEEMESANEELLAINQELQLRNEQITEAYDYAESVFVTIREAVVVLDRDLRIKKANKSFYQLFRIREDEAEGRLIYGLGDRQLNIPRLRELLENIIPMQEQYNGFEVRHVFPDIGEKVMLLNARRIEQQAHRRQLILLAIEDITEYRKAQQIVAEREAWFRNMADNAPVMIWVAGTDKQATFFNRTWLEFTGRRLEEETGNGFTRNIHIEDVPLFTRSFNQCFQDKQPFELEYRLRRRDGEYRWTLNIGKPAYSHEGRFTGYIISCTDIHDKKMAAEELARRVQEKTNDLQQINKTLQRTNNELQQFAYVASHDLQEPLRKIITFSDRLNQRFNELLPDTGRTYIEKIIASALRMSHLLQDLLNFSQLANTHDVFGNADLNEIVTSVVVGLREQIQQKKAQIRYDALPAIQGIPHQLELLFHHLLSNALKFAHPQRLPVISISAKKLSQDKLQQLEKLNRSLLYYEIVVTDNGIGFNQEFARQIFIIFQRLNDKHEFSGTGIGLALCQKITGNHNGEIFARSKEGEGSAFHVILPAKQP